MHASTITVFTLCNRANTHDRACNLLTPVCCRVYRRYDAGHCDASDVTDRFGCCDSDIKAIFMELKAIDDLVGCATQAALIGDQRDVWGFCSGC